MAFAMPISGARTPLVRTVAGAMAEALAGIPRPACPVNLPNPVEDVNGDAHFCSSFRMGGTICVGDSIPATYRSLSTCQTVLRT